MNRLFYNRCYLSGPIDNATDLGVGWRLKAQQELTSLDIITLNPCDKAVLVDTPHEDWENHELRHTLKQQGDFDAMSHIMRQIRCFDLRMADLCDFAIAHLDLNVYSTGTHEEITTMNRRKIPILTHVEQGKASLPDWYFGMLPQQMIFDTWEELFDYVRHIAFTDTAIEAYSRWQFIDYGTLYGKRKIPISKNLVARVSPEDHEYLNQWKWSAANQVAGKQQNRRSPVWRAMRKVVIDGRKITRYMHQDVIIRQIGKIPTSCQIDHIDRNPLNNERANLRVVTRSENLHNRGPQINNTTGVKGVWQNSVGNYVAELKYKGIKHHLGTYPTLEAAKVARCKFGKTLLGEDYYDGSD